MGAEPIENAQLLRTSFPIRGRISCSSISSKGTSSGKDGSSSSSREDSVASLCSPDRLLLRLTPTKSPAAAQEVPLKVEEQQQQQQQRLLFSLEDAPEGTYTLTIAEKGEGEHAERICWKQQSFT
ncbi:hypothetical protein ETH_00043900, partial [Eimeria tenella]